MRFEIVIFLFLPKFLKIRCMKLTQLGALLVFASVVSVFAACSKKSEDQQMLDYIAKKGWTASGTSEGLYYVQDTSALGSGGYPNASSTVKVKYTGYLLDETVFDSNSSGFTTSLTKVIVGWQIGIPKFKKGGKGHLLIPSALGYGSSGAGSIPGSVPIVFDIELVSF